MSTREFQDCRTCNPLDGHTTEEGCILWEQSHNFVPQELPFDPNDVIKVRFAEEPEQAPWWQTHDGLVTLTAWMAENCFEAANVAHAVEKPWNWDTEYQIAKAEQDGDEELAARLRDEWAQS